jgi:hypothetical protein
VDLLRDGFEEQDKVWDNDEVVQGMCLSLANISATLPASNPGLIFRGTPPFLPLQLCYG